MVAVAELIYLFVYLFIYKIITSDARYDTTTTYGLNRSTKIKTRKLSETQYNRSKLSKDKQKSGMKHKNCILVFFLTQMLHYSFASARHQ